MKENDINISNIKRIKRIFWLNLQLEDSFFVSYNDSWEGYVWWQDYSQQ